MITRREVALGGLLTIAWTALPCMCRAQASRVRHTFGCVLADDEADQFLSTSTYADDAPMIPRSGDPDLDFALAQTLSRLSDTFQVLPGFAYFDDYESPNALASPKNRRGRPDGTVLYGMRLLKLKLGATESPDAAVASVCVHEFGHIVQLKHGLMRVLMAGQSTVKRKELHADFLAGYFAGIRKLQNRNFPAAAFATSQYEAGDPWVADRNHHGTPEERGAAVVRGFEAAYRERRRIGEAIEIGLNYVSAL